MKFRKTLTIALLSLPVLLVIVVLVTVTLHNYKAKILKAENKSGIELAILELEARNYNNAKGIFSNLIIADSQDLAAVIGMNSIYLLRKEYDESYNLLIQYQESDNSTIIKSLAQTCFALKKYDLAIQYGLKALTINPKDDDAIITVLKSINLSRNIDALNSLLEKLNIQEISDTTKFLLTITELNFGTNKIAELSNIKAKLSSEFQYVANEYEANYTNISIANKELIAKTNICFALINVGLWEYANVFAEDMFNINKYYENSLMFHSIVNINLHNYSESIQDLESLRKHTTTDINANVLLLEAYIGSKYFDKADELLAEMIINFNVENEAQYLEAFKVLYNAHDYDLFWKLYLGVASKMDYNAVAVYYMAMKIAVYRQDYLILPLIIEKVSVADETLNVAERSNYIAAQALIAYNKEEVEKTNSLINTAEELYFYDPFVHYVKSIIYNNADYLSRAYELDIQNEIPKIEATQ